MAATMVNVARLQSRQDHRGVGRRIGMLMGFEAATLAVAACVHLAGGTPGGSQPPYDATDAGIAEAVIGVVLALGAAAVLRGASRARTAALGATVFAILGFLVGLNFTVQGGDVPDVAYHATMLPVLIASLIFIARTEPALEDREQASTT